MSTPTPSAEPTWAASEAQGPRGSPSLSPTRTLCLPLPASALSAPISCPAPQPPSSALFLEPIQKTTLHSILELWSFCVEKVLQGRKLSFSSFFICWCGPTPASWVKRRRERLSAEEGVGQSFCNLWTKQYWGLYLFKNILNKKSTAGLFVSPLPLLAPLWGLPQLLPPEAIPPHLADSPE